MHLEVYRNCLTPYLWLPANSFTVDISSCAGMALLRGLTGQSQKWTGNRYESGICHPILEGSSNSLGWYSGRIFYARNNKSRVISDPAFIFRI